MSSKREDVVKTAGFRDWYATLTNPEGLQHLKECSVCASGYVERYRAYVRRGGVPALTVGELLAKAQLADIEQIEGDDLRLAKFWAKAAEMADETGQCRVYDDLAEKLGGPRREDN